MTLTKKQDIEKELRNLESLHRNQVANGRHFYWERNDDVKGDFWQARANETKNDILKFKKEHDITTPNWWE